MPYYGVTPTDFVPMMREHIEDPVVLNKLIYNNYKLYGLLQKDEKTDGGGKALMCPVSLSGGQGVSANPQSAYANMTSGQDVEFAIPWQDYYAFNQIEGKTLRLSENPKNAFASALNLKMDNGLAEIGKKVAWSLYRTGTGTIGKIASITNGLITLANFTDAFVFEQDQQLQAYAGDGTGGQVTGGAVAWVVGVDALNGQVLVSPTQGGAPATPTNWSTSFPYLVNSGDFQIAPVGALGWIPVGAARPQLGVPNIFNGVDRSKQIQKLAGTYVDYTQSGANIEESLIDLVTKQATFDGHPDVIMVNPSSYGALEKSLGARMVLGEVHSSTGIGYEGIKIHAGGDSPIVLADPFCPARTALSMQLSDWCLVSVGGKFPQHLIYPNGQEFVVPPNLDAIQFRLGGHAALRCRAPGHQASALLTE